MSGTHIWDTTPFDTTYGSGAWRGWHIELILPESLPANNVCATLRFDPGKLFCKIEIP